MWKNKHVVIAMLVAPILSVIAWFAVDRMVGEQPHAAKKGGAYELVGRSNCRYASGVCELSNGEFELTINAESTDGKLSLVASHTLSGAVAARGTSDQDYRREVSFVPESAESNRWWIDLGPDAQATDRIRLAVSASGATYYAELPMTFIEGEDPSI
ncbi:MAG: hypothetical protein AAF578_01735 [Pseudomonadota bacterium]